TDLAFGGEQLLRRRDLQLQACQVVREEIGHEIQACELPRNWIWNCRTLVSTATIQSLGSPLILSWATCDLPPCFSPARMFGSDPSRAMKAMSSAGGSK